MSISFVPKKYTKLFFEKLVGGLKYVYEKNGVYYSQCAGRPDDVFFMFDNRWVQIRGEDMVIDISPKQDMSLCMVNFLPSVDDYWVIGNSIYKEYYVTHNPDQNIIAFTPNERLIKEPLYLDSQPTKKLVEVYDGWMLLAKFLSSLAIGIAIWCLSEYGFGGTTGGGDGSNWSIAFLNAGSIKKVQSENQIKEALAKRIASMDVNEVQSMINKIKVQQSGEEKAGNVLE